ncbi:MAG: HAD-IA family hydrolase [Anaerolineae bacterium]|nr:HAD-IA family hydrolase [Anaerolineae bacterium]
MVIRGIFFDAAGVLYTRDERRSKVVARLLGERGLSDELSSEQQARQKVLRSQANKGGASPEEYWDQVLQMYGVAATEERRGLVAQIDEYADRVVPMPGVREALMGLKERGFLLGVITDTMYSVERKKRWLQAVGALDLLDVLACSTVLGVHKPERAIYLQAVAQANLTAGESAFVGHAADELAGARRAGLVTVAVHRDPGATADYYAGSLVDLLNVPIFRGLAA